MESPEITITKSFNSNNAGLAVLKQELKDSNLLKILDKDCPKHSGFKSSEILNLCIFKNIMNISTFTETSEIFEELPELSLNLSRTTISRNLTKIGGIKNYNFYLLKFVEDLIKKYKINPKTLRTIVDETTIEVSQTSKTYENVGWVWDNAQSKIIWGYEVTIIGIGFNEIFLPVHFELGKMSKENLLTRFEIIRMFIGSSIILFDGGFICDDFFKELTKSSFIFYSKVGKKWKFEFGSKMNVKQIKRNIGNVQSLFKSKHI